MITGVECTISGAGLLSIVRAADTGTMSFVAAGTIAGAGIDSEVWEISLSNSAALKLTKSLSSSASAVKSSKCLITALNVVIRLCSQESGYGALCTGVLPACFALAVTVIGSDPDLDLVDLELDLVLPSSTGIGNFSGRANQCRRGSSVLGKADVFRCPVSRNRDICVASFSGSDASDVRSSVID